MSAPTGPTSCAATPRCGRPASCGRIRSGAGCCAPNPITAFGRRRCCSTCATRSAPATSGWRGRAATAISGRRCCRFPPSLMPTAACRSRPVRTTGSPSAGTRWTRVCASWPTRREPVRSLAAASKTACSALKGRKAQCRTGPLTWSPTSTGECPTRGSRTFCSRWTTPPGSPRPSPTCDPGSPVATASVCSTCCSPRESTSACARWPKPRPRTGSGN